MPEERYAQRDHHKPPPSWGWGGKAKELLGSGRLFSSLSLSQEQLCCRASRVWGEPLGGVSSGSQRRIATVRVFRRFHKTKEGMRSHTGHQSLPGAFSESHMAGPMEAIPSPLVGAGGLCLESSPACENYCDRDPVLKTSCHRGLCDHVKVMTSLCRFWLRKGEIY